MKTCLRGFANNKDADQPAHPRSLISAFVIRLLERILFAPATCKISIFYLVTEAEQTGLKLILSETLKTGFVALQPIWHSDICIFSADTGQAECSFHANYRNPF